MSAVREVGRPGSGAARGRRRGTSSTGHSATATAGGRRLAASPPASTSSPLDPRPRPDPQEFAQIAGGYAIEIVGHAANARGDGDTFTRCEGVGRCNRFVPAQRSPLLPLQEKYLQISLKPTPGLEPGPGKQAKAADSEGQRGARDPLAVFGWCSDGTDRRRVRRRRCRRHVQERSPATTHHHDHRERGGEGEPRHQVPAHNRCARGWATASRTQSRITPHGSLRPLDPTIPVGGRTEMQMERGVPRPCQMLVRSCGEVSGLTCGRVRARGPTLTRCRPGASAEPPRWAASSVVRPYGTLQR